MSRRGAVLQDYGGTLKDMPLDSQLQASQLEQRNNEFQQQQKQRQQELKQKQQGDATDFIGGLKVDHVGDNTIDLYNDAQIGKLQGELNDMQSRGASVQDIKIKAMQELPKIAQGYTIAKNGYDKITNGLKDLNKDYPSGNMEAARNVAGKEFVKDIFNFDDKGNVTGYKDPSIIPQDKNYLADLQNPDNLTKWYSQSGTLEKHVSTLPHTTIGESTKVRDSRGREIDNAWSGTGTVFSTIKRDANGKAIGQDIKSETVPLGKNPDGTDITIDVLPREEFNTLLGNKQAAADFILKFNDHLKQLNIDPKKLDPRAEDYLQRQYARDWLKETGIEGSSFIPKVLDKQPLPPRISIKVNNGGSEANSIDVYTPTKTIVDEHFANQDNYKPIVTDNGVNVYGAVPVNSLDDKLQESILTIAKSKDKEVESIGDIFLKKVDDGGIGVIKKADNSLITTITKTGANIQANTPLGMKAKNEAVRKAGEHPKTTSTFDIIDPTTGKVVMKGVDQIAADKAKSKGYKIQ